MAGVAGVAGVAGMALEVNDAVVMSRANIAGTAVSVNEVAAFADFTGIAVSLPRTANNSMLRKAYRRA